MQIKLYDRVKLKDGRTGSIVYESGFGLNRFLCVTDNGHSIWMSRDIPAVIEIIGHRYFVDTPLGVSPENLADWIRSQGDTND